VIKNIQVFVVSDGEEMKHGFAHMLVFEDWLVEHKEKYNMSNTFWLFQNMESCKNHSPMEGGIKGKKTKTVREKDEHNLEFPLRKGRASPFCQKG